MSKGHNFPLNSTSYETSAVARIVRVMRRTPTAKEIAYGGCFDCRPIAGSDTWSQHAYGNAVDLFPKAGPIARELDDIFHACIYQATHKTVPNRGTRIPAAEIIHHNGRLIWTPSSGIQHYDGTLGAHIHVSGAPLRSGRPACA